MAADNSESNTLSGHVALVTGGSRGIGLSIACELAAAGAAVAICSRGKPALSVAEEVLSSFGVPCLVQPCDIRSPQQVESFVSCVEKELGQVDILVNNASIYRTEPVQGHSLEIWNEVLETNVTGAMLLSRRVLSGMIELNWGRIINISSVSGKVGEIWGSAYSASKFALIGFTQSLSLEVARNGITVNAVCPGWVDTEMAKGQLEDPQWCKLNSVDPSESLSNACFSVPQMRFIEPSEVAALVVFLASVAARGITGQSINICGGLSLH